MSLTDCEHFAVNRARAMLQESGVWSFEEDLSCLIDRYIERGDKVRALEEFMLRLKSAVIEFLLGIL